MNSKTPKQSISNRIFANRHVQRATLAGSALIATIGGASAEGGVINTTMISGIFEDLGVIFPSIGNMVVTILPTILILAVVGFAIKFFDKILAIFDKVIH